MKKTITVSGINWEYNMNSVDIQFSLDSIPKGANIKEVISNHIDKELDKYPCKYTNFDSFKEKKEDSSVYLFINDQDISICNSSEKLFEFITFEKDENKEALEFFGEAPITSMAEVYIYFRDYAIDEKIFVAVNRDKNSYVAAVKNSFKTFFTHQCDPEIITKLNKKYPYQKKNIHFTSTSNRNFLFISRLIAIEKALNEYHDLEEQENTLEKILVSHSIREIKEQTSQFSETYGLIRVFNGKKGEDNVHIKFFPKTQKIIITIQRQDEVFSYKEGVLLEESSSILKPYKEVKSINYEYEVDKSYKKAILEMQSQLDAKFGIYISSYQNNTITLNFENIVNQEHFIENLPQLKGLFIRFLKVSVDDQDLEQFMTMLKCFIQDGHKKINLKYHI